MSPLQHDPIHHPAHYLGKGGLQAIDVIKAFGLRYHLGTAVKYILRYQKKGRPVEDLGKCLWYLRDSLNSVPYRWIYPHGGLEITRVISAFELPPNIAMAIKYITDTHLDGEVVNSMQRIERAIVRIEMEIDDLKDLEIIYGVNGEIVAYSKKKGGANE